MKKKKNEFGITLIELIIAVLILMVGILSIANMFIRGALNVVTVSNADLAIDLCREKLEEVKMRQADYNSLIAQPPPFPTMGTTTIGGRVATWRIIIEGINDATQKVTPTPAEGDYLRVTVSVTWRENIEHNRRLFTYIGKVR